jgi:hypothetical protein
MGMLLVPQSRMAITRHAHANQIIFVGAAALGILGLDYANIGPMAIETANTFKQ